MKNKKAEKKKQEQQNEKQVDQKELMAEISQYLKISETETKLKEKEKERENEEFLKLKNLNEEMKNEFQKLKESDKLEELFNKTKELVLI